MNKYEQLFTEDVWNRLKKRLKGKIFAGIRNDVMKVSVKCDEFYFEKIEEDMAKKIVTGEIKSSDFVYEFETEYKKYIQEQINKRLFY